MAVKSVADLRTQFEKGDTPTAADFIDLLDSFLHAGLGNFPDPLPALSAKNLKDIEQAFPDPLPPLDARNLFNIVQSEWVTVIETPTWATPTSFVLLGDFTDAFHERRPVRLTIAGVDFVTEVLSSSVAGDPAVTTVVVLDAMPGSDLTAVAVSLLRAREFGGTLPRPEWTTGDAKLTFKTTADTGWILVDDGSIGSVDSGAPTRANADTEALFTLFWTNIAEAWCPVQDATGTPVARGASAAADFAANRRLVIPKQLGRALAIAGTGTSLSARALGEALGEEAHALTADESVPHDHGAAGDHQHASAGTHTHPIEHAHASGSDAQSHTIPEEQAILGGPENDLAGAAAGDHQHASAGTHTHASFGGGQAHNNMQPSSFLNIMVKL